MSYTQYKTGKRIRNITQFDKCKSRFYIVWFGGKRKTLHRGFIEAWQYHYLKQMIETQGIWIAEKINNKKKKKQEKN